MSHPGYLLHLIGHPVLNRTAKPIGDRISRPEWTHIATGMAVTAVTHQGVAIAAPQVGMSCRLCVIVEAGPDDEIQWVAMLDPEIIERDGEQLSREGCLSIPGRTFDVLRAESISFTYRDPEGGTHTADVTGFGATVIQHELDHLDGLCVDQRALETARTLTAMRAGR